MGSIKKNKINITKEQLSNFLREAADHLEGRKIDSSHDISTEYENLDKVIFTFKRLNEIFTLKIRLKDSTYIEQCNSDQQEKYKTLKNRMKVSFNLIVQDIEKEVIPTGEHLNEFLSDSEKMIRFDGFGDEYYDGYKNAYKSLKKACEQKD